jgi:hypothetical protein
MLVRQGLWGNPDVRSSEKKFEFAQIFVTVVIKVEILAGSNFQAGRGVGAGQFLQLIAALARPA